MLDCTMYKNFSTALLRLILFLYGLWDVLVLTCTPQFLVTPFPSSGPGRRQGEANEKKTEK